MPRVGRTLQPLERKVFGRSARILSINPETKSKTYGNQKITTMYCPPFVRHQSCMRNCTPPQFEAQTEQAAFSMPNEFWSGCKSRLSGTQRRQARRAF